MMAGCVLRTWEKMSYDVYNEFTWHTDVVEAHPLPQRFPLEIALLE